MYLILKALPFLRRFENFVESCLVKAIIFFLNIVKTVYGSSKKTYGFHNPYTVRIWVGGWFRIIHL